MHMNKDTLCHLFQLEHKRGIPVLLIEMNNHLF